MCQNEADEILHLLMVSVIELTGKPNSKMMKWKHQVSRPVQAEETTCSSSQGIQRGQGSMKGGMRKACDITTRCLIWLAFNMGVRGAPLKETFRKRQQVQKREDGPRRMKIKRQEQGTI
jgi:hypothetical protein